MTYNHDSFKGYTHNDIIAFITDINDALNEDLQIADKQSNIRTLYEYLTKYNAQQFIGVPFNMNYLDNFLYNEKKRRADNEFFNKFDKNEYKANDALDEFTRMNTQNKFDKQLRIENAIKRAHYAVSEAIKPINESKTPVASFHLFLMF